MCYKTLLFVINSTTDSDHMNPRPQCGDSVDTQPRGRYNLSPPQTVPFFDTDTVSQDGLSYASVTNPQISVLWHINHFFSGSHKVLCGPKWLSRQLSAVLAPPSSVILWQPHSDLCFHHCCCRGGENPAILTSSLKCLPPEATHILSNPILSGKAGSVFLL